MSNYEKENFEHWIGFDLDGTLCTMDEWVSIDHFGEPIQETINVLKNYLNDGWKVKIVTARAARYFNNGLEELAKTLVQDWCEKHIGVRLEVTAEKDYGMRLLYDDRAVMVEHNTGKVFENINHKPNNPKEWSKK